MIHFPERLFIAENLTAENLTITVRNVFGIECVVNKKSSDPPERKPGSDGEFCNHTPETQAVTRHEEYFELLKEFSAMHSLRSTAMVDQFRSFKWALLVSVTFLGCQKSWDQPDGRATIEGTLKLEGKPTGPFTATFVSNLHGTQGAAQVGEDGTFRLENDVPVSNYSVYLSAPTEGKPPAGIPQRYYSDTSSDLRFEARPGLNTLELEMKR